MEISALMGEEFTVGLRNGVELNVLAESVSSGSGSNAKLIEHWPRFLFKGNFKPGFALDLAVKDIRLDIDLATELSVPVELLNLVLERYSEAQGRGWGTEDADAVVRLNEEATGIELRSRSAIGT